MRRPSAHLFYILHSALYPKYRQGQDFNRHDFVRTMQSHFGCTGLIIDLALIILKTREPYLHAHQPQRT